MATKVQFKRVLALPATPVDGAIYFVANENTFKENSLISDGDGIYLGWNSKFVNLCPARKTDEPNIPKGLMIFRGISSTDPLAGPVTIGGEVVSDIELNNVVAYDSKEYICEGFDDSDMPKWRELGDENQSGGVVVWEEDGEDQGEQEEKEDQEQQDEPKRRKPLTFTALEDGTKVSMDQRGPDLNLVYSTDGGETWSPFVLDETVVALNNGEKVSIKASSPNPVVGDGNTFVIDGSVDASGSIMSLVDGENFDTLAEFSAPSAMAYLFDGCVGLKSAPELPATTLTPKCYDGMFFGCTGLTSAPDLPATNLAEECYSQMFYECSSLTTAPELPSTTLAESCYESMFCCCSSLTSAPALNATTMADSCYASMFQGCTSLVDAPALPATQLAVNCYTGMFSECTSLVNAPALSAETMAELCYEYMFGDCTSLVNAPSLPAMALADGCYKSMFWGCTGLTEAPKLKATELAADCYANMFVGCSSLQLIEIGYTGNFNSSFSSWVGDETDESASGVAETGTLRYTGTDTTTGASAIPPGWTVETQDSKDQY